MTATLRDTPIGVDAQPDLVTVVVPARDEAASIADCLESIRRQSHRDLQIVVIDGRSTDGTAEIVRAIADDDPRVELVDNPDRVVPAGLNRALAAARGRWFVRVDAHATVPPDYVARAVQLLRSGRWGGVGGRKDGVGRTVAGRAVAAAMGSRVGVGNSTYHHGAQPTVVEHVPFGAYPTELVRDLGGWAEDLVVNQDFEFDHRVRAAGHEILFDPDLRIEWHCRQTLRALFRQYRRYGRGKAQVLARHPSSAKPRHLLPAGLVAGAAGALALSVRGRPAALTFFGPYAAFVGIGSLGAMRAVDLPARPLVPGAVVAMHFGYGLGLFEGAADVVRRSEVADPRANRRMREAMR